MCNNFKIKYKKIGAVLAKVIKKAYGHLGETYLVIEEIKIQTDDFWEDGTKVFDYYIVGRYGVKDRPETEKHFDFIASSDESLANLSGYFNCLVDYQDGAYEK